MAEFKKGDKARYVGPQNALVPRGSVCTVAWQSGHTVALEWDGVPEGDRAAEYWETGASELEHLQ